MASTAVMTIRIEPALLEALKAKARDEGRTVSAEVVRLVRKEVEPRPARSVKRVKTMGMFPDFEAPDLHELVRARRAFSSSLRRSTSRRSRKRS
jgi:hypothetical protein